MSDDAAVVRQVLSNRGNYYALFGVARDAPEDVVKRAYKKLALKCHPDKNKDARASEAFKLVNTAHSVLTDSAKRRTYDRYGSEGVQAQESGASPTGRPGMRRHHTEADVFQDLFSQMFGGAPPRRGPRPQPQHGHHQQQGPELNINIAMALPFLLFLLFAFILQSSTLTGGGGGDSWGSGRSARRGLFSLHRSNRDGFTMERVTAHVAELKDARVSYYVRPHFDEYLRRYSISRRSVELEVLRQQRSYLDRRCYAELQRERARGPARSKAEPALCTEASRFRYVPSV